MQTLSTLNRALLSCVVLTAAGVASWYGYEQGRRDRASVKRPAAMVKPQRARISVVYRGAGGGGPLPPALLPCFELILDSSFSMSGQIEDQSKSDVAHRVTKELLQALPDSVQVGLRLYGHWGKWLAHRDDPEAEPLEPDDPRLDTDSELVVPLGGLTAQRRELLNSWIDWATPRGKTPLVYSLLQAKRDFPSHWRGARTIILVSDGYETCGGKLADIAAAYGDAATGIVVHVVGFAVEGSETHGQLARIARVAGGNYYRADGAAELADALRQAVYSPAFVVYDQAGEHVMARGLINNAALDLLPGKYRVAVQGFEEHAIPIEVGEGGALALGLNDRGELTVEASASDVGD